MIGFFMAIEKGIQQEGSVRAGRAYQSENPMKNGAPAERAQRFEFFASIQCPT
jgi:hypothetical protein